MASLRFAYVASEVTGFAKTGGLADVAGSLPRALAQRGLDGAVFLPLYRSVRTGKQRFTPTGHVISVPMGNRLVAGALCRSTLPASDVPVYLIEHTGYFERDDPNTKAGIYQFAAADGTLHDYPDNGERFVFFQQAVLEAFRLLDFWPDVLHVNDWQTGLLPAYLRELYGRHPNFALRPHYERIRTLCTIHNLAFQGLFAAQNLPLTGLPARLYNSEQLEFHNQISFLKAGLVFADWINTVSPTYAQEIQTRYFGCGLQGVLTMRHGQLSGIMNGIDDRVWNPATDKLIPANYTVDTVRQGKPLCKAALQRRYGLAPQPHTPLLGMIARLADQKGVDLLLEILPALMNEGVQLVVLGLGDPKYQQLLRAEQQRHAAHFGLTLALDEELAHQIEAGADIFLMPSKYEPAGLNQMYSLKYGTVPVVRATGGLNDTVTDATPENLANGAATGFKFAAVAGFALLEAIQRALTLFRHQPGRWLQLVHTGMRQDWSWNRSAAEYERLYVRITEERP